MRFSSAIVAAGVASHAGAQVLLPNGSFSCPIPNGAYCLAENIILRCIGSLGFPGNCNDNLAGEPPFGVNPTLCVTPCGNETGRAACSKNGIVYPASGVGLGNVTFPVGDTSVCNSVTSSSSTSSSLTSSSTSSSLTSSATSSSATSSSATSSSATSSSATPSSSTTPSSTSSFATSSSSTSSSSAVSVSTPYNNRTSTSSGLASPTSSIGGGTPSASTVPFTGDASSSGMIGAGAVVGFGAIFVAINML